MAYEEPTYTVIESTDRYEVRLYEPYIVAEVDVDGDFESAGGDAFRLLAGYIFGDNVANEKMAMTTPVESTTGTKMAMTAPVLSKSMNQDLKMAWAISSSVRFIFRFSSILSSRAPRIPVMRSCSAKGGSGSKTFRSSLCLIPVTVVPEERARS